ncbi:hypothetical protein AGLY_000894 [Aphis glycines]|uniref:Uncharacterized protein n=1 Tax=Aphis glycines TaxID=307491 RepID=A0A6G0U896_APHGL|nr:hypothetical protein AGLY_000894 [Aphis glycines]
MRQIKLDDMRICLNFDNSERSDECIDFTMIITSQNNAPISNYGGWFPIGKKLTFSNIFQNNREKQKKNDGKTGIFTQNQFSTESIFLYGCNSKTNHCKYLKISPNIYNSIIFIHVGKKILDDQKNLKIVYTSNFYEICRKRENLQVFLELAIKKTRSIIIEKILSAFEFKIFTKSRNDNDLSSNDFKYLLLFKKHNFFLLAFEVQILTKTRQNHEYLQIILLTNNLRSESFFVYNDTYHCIQI